MAAKFPLPIRNGNDRVLQRARNLQGPLSIGVLPNAILGDFMTEAIVSTLASEFSSRGYSFHKAPLKPVSESVVYWTVSNKHGNVTGRDVEFLRLYVLLALATEKPLFARGILVRDHGYARLDKAVMNSCLNRRLVVLENGVFRITPDGIKTLGLDL